MLEIKVGIPVAIAHTHCPDISFKELNEIQSYLADLELSLDFLGIGNCILNNESGFSISIPQQTVEFTLDL